jgi:hypothetical protein
MSIETKLKCILEGTFIEETVLTSSETDELYDLKDKVKTARDRMLFIKDPSEKRSRQAELEHMEDRLHSLRSKAFARG